MYLKLSSCFWGKVALVSVKWSHLCLTCKSQQFPRKLQIKNCWKAQVQTETRVHDLSQALTFSDLKLWLHLVIGSCFHCLAAFHFGDCSSQLKQSIMMVLLSWLGMFHSSAVRGAKSVLLPSSDTLGLILAGSGAQDSYGPVLWSGTKDPFSGLCLTFLLPRMCSPLSILELEMEMYLPCRDLTGFHLSLKPGEQLSCWGCQASITQSLPCYCRYLGNNCLVLCPWNRCLLITAAC